MKTQKKTRIAAAAVAGVGIVAGAAFGLAPAAFADAPIPQFGSVAGITKVSALTGAPLAGADLTVCSALGNPLTDMTSGDFQTQRDRYAQVADGVSFEAYEANVAAIVAEIQAEVDAVVGILDDATLADHQAKLDALAAAEAAAAPFNETVATANAERQRLADEILALQDAGEPVPAELAAAHADAVAAQEAAIAEAAPYNEAVADARDAALGAREAVETHEAAVEERDALVVQRDAAQARLDDAASTWDSSRFDVFTEMTERMDYMLDVSGNVAPYTVGDQRCYDLTTPESGVVYFPTMYDYTVTETAAPDGYERIEGTMHVTVAGGGSYDPDSGFMYYRTQTSDNAALTVTDSDTYSGTGETGGAVFDGTLSNTPVEEPPVVPEEPVEPPVEKPVEPPVTPEKPTETLAMTGADASSTLAVGGVAAALAAAGAALTLFRRRTAE